MVNLIFPEPELCFASNAELLSFFFRMRLVVVPCVRSTKLIESDKFKD